MDALRIIYTVCTHDDQIFVFIKFQIFKSIYKIYVKLQDVEQHKKRS